MALIELKLQGLDGKMKADSLARQVTAEFPKIVAGPFLKRIEEPTRPQLFTVFELKPQPIRTFIVAHQSVEGLQEAGNSIKYTTAGKPEQVIFDSAEPRVIKPFQLDRLVFGDAHVRVTNGNTTLGAYTRGQRLPAGSEHVPGEALQPTELLIFAGFDGKTENYQLPYEAMLSLKPVETK